MTFGWNLFLEPKQTSNAMCFSIIVFVVVAMEVGVSLTFENFKVACLGVAALWLKTFNPNSTCWKYVELSQKLKGVVCIMKEEVLHIYCNN